MADQKIPDHTAVRVALWRALHVQADPRPHIFEDEIGLKLADPGPDWRKRPDMDLKGTLTYRTSIVTRARFIEDLMIAEAKRDVKQYVILGAGLDTFAQRRNLGIEVYEIDKPVTQDWKKQRLKELDVKIPSWLHFVPVDFEAGDSWPEKLKQSGFDSKKPTVISSAGVAMYLTHDAIVAKLKQCAQLAPGSTLVMSYLVPIELTDPEEQQGRRDTEARAKAAGTAFISTFTPEQIKKLALDCGFKKAHTVSAEDYKRLYFSGRTDGLRPSNSEQILVATT